jgi:benzylsuccinate CoA-transferase BbsF subunit
MQEIADDPHLRQRGALTAVDDPVAEKRFAIGMPARFSKAEGVGIRRGTPALGQDEDYVFGELLGLNSTQRAELEDREIIF